MRQHSHVTKVPATPCRLSVILAVSVAIQLFAPPGSSQATPARQPGPAESLYLQLSSIGLDPGRAFKVRGASLERSAIHITLEDGTIAFTKDALDSITEACFESYRSVVLSAG